MNIIGIIIVVFICGYIISIFVRTGIDGGMSGGCLNTIIVWAIILIIAATVIFSGYQAIKHPYTPW